MKPTRFLFLFLCVLAAPLFAADETEAAAANATDAVRPHPALSGIIPVLEFRGSYYAETIEMLRNKGTILLRKNTQNESAVLIFEWRFDPHMVAQGPLQRATYKASNVPFDKVLTDVLAQFDLRYEIVGPDRIAILARTKEVPK